MLIGLLFIVSILNSKKENADDSSLPTLDSINPKIRQERAARSQPKPAASEAEAEKLEGGPDAQQIDDERPEEAAFNPETGEINWDCPCLGGMAHGPCGEEFKAAFSCFVYSKEEPKGIECIDKFKYVNTLSYRLETDADNSVGACKIASANTLTCTAPSWRTTTTLRAVPPPRNKHPPPKSKPRQPPRRRAPVPRKPTSR